MCSASKEIYKEVIAFANTDGGIVYVGIDNAGNAVGLTNVDEEYTRLYNLTREMKELGLIRIDGRGKDKEYLLKISKSSSFYGAFGVR